MPRWKRNLLVLLLALVAFGYQYARSPSFRRQCGRLMAEWRGGGSRTAALPSGGKSSGHAGRVVVSAAAEPGGKWDNLDLGTPGRCDQVLEREGYALGYVEAWEQPAWVAYRLTKDEVMSRKSSRMDAFMFDPEIKTGSAMPEDYQGSGYDRGHLAPAGDMHWSDKTMLESFYMSNMSPQDPSFNRGVWSKLEQAVRRFAYSEGSVFVVTGPIVTEDDTKTIGPSKVRVPGFYYKVVYDETPPEKMIAFILPNKGSKTPLDSFVVTVDDVEEATGLDFFSALPPEKQAKLESHSDPDAWPWRDKRRGGR